MNVLLVNPYIYDFTAYDLWLKPMGLLYIASVLKEYTDCRVHWLDLLDRAQPGAYETAKEAKKASRQTGRGKFHREEVEKPAIYAGTPRIYARYGMPFRAFLEKLDQMPQMDLIFVTSLMTYWVEGVAVTVNTLKEKFPAAKIILGGIIPSLVPPRHLENLIHADTFIGGYGESRVLEIVKDHGGRILEYPDFSGIDSLPYPAVELLGNQDVLPLLTSRGCPFHCTYCASDILNEKFIQRDYQQIRDEILFMANTYGTRHFAVFDDALLIDKRKRFFKVFGTLGDEDGLCFHTPNGIHAREIDEETAEIFFRSGFKTLRLSFESTSSAILTKSAGKVTVKEMVKAVENLEKVGYKRGDIGVYLLFGAPGQKGAEVRASLDFAEALEVTPHLAHFSPVPGTADFLALQKAGKLSTPVDLYETNKLYYLYNKSGYSVDEITSIKDRAWEVGEKSRKK